MIKYLMKSEIFFEVNRERLIYDSESQHAAALAHISYHNTAGVQTLCFFISK